MNKLVKRFQFKILFAVLLICGSWVGNSVFAQSPVIKTSVDKNGILIGGQIKYRVEISFPINKYRLQWFDLPEEMNHFVIVAKDKVDSSTNQDINTFGQTIILTSFDSGRQFIPAMPLRINAINGEDAFTMFTDSIPINVMHSPLDSIQPFHDIKTIIEVKAGWKWWVWALIIAGGILLIAIIIFVIRSLRNKKQVMDIFASKLTPYDEAVKALSDLGNEQLLSKHGEKEFHLRVSQIFKRYLSRKLNVNKMHLTTDDILIEITPMDVEKSSIANLANSLRMGNAVKFAQFIPAATDSEHCKNVVKEMITEINTSIDKTISNDR